MKAKVDMSSEAITVRLEAVRALYKLCMSLAQAGKQALRPSTAMSTRSGSHGS
ncbi:MAG: hypothetical protein IPQ07_01670 [Myxococcales bacterium]|nr:hypothetical protein [Myxococcales bacterium]